MHIPSSINSFFFILKKKKREQEGVSLDGERNREFVQKIKEREKQKLQLCYVV